MSQNLKLEEEVWADIFAAAARLAKAANSSI
jgi:hypothetical protein